MSRNKKVRYKAFWDPRNRKVTLLSYEDFWNLCNKRFQELTNDAISLYDCDEYVNPGNYYYQGMSEKDAQAAIDEFIQDLAEEGFPL